jgi:gliding motility-associated-like protein
VGDDQYDSGVFLQAKSLSSNVIQLTPTTQTTPQNQNYLVEGCVPGSFDIKRDQNDPAPLNITLTYSGSATNGVDVQPLPPSVVIPANQSAVTVNVVPIVDNVPEGIETLVIYALAGCTSGPPSDSLVIQIRDFDTLDIVPRTAVVCKGGQIQLVAGSGYNTYQWNPDPTLNNTNIPNPIASPTATSTTYICTANQNNCNARDSAVIFTKDIDFISKTDINCNGSATGEIRVGAGNYWIRPVEFSINGGPWQADSTFTNLPAGTYTVSVRDISGCIDNLTVDIIASPALVISNVAVTAASCSGASDGTVTVTATGGQPPYTYSSNGVNYQPGNVLNLLSNNYVISVKDNAGCITTSNVSVPLNNTITVDAGANVQICENTSYIIPAVSNASQFSWTPAGTLQNSNTLNPTASPAGPTEYFITATTGICSAIDSITIDIRPAPVADAGPDANICSGQSIQLNGSGGTGFEWSPSNYFQSPTNISNPFVRPPSTFSYALVVTDQFNCRSLTADSVTIIVVPTVRISAGRDTIVALNQPLQLNAFEIGNAGVTQFTWSPGLYLNDPTIANPIAVFPVPVLTAPYEYYYTVTGTTPVGCEGTAAIRIRVYKGPDIYVPNAFSPNNDGKNDLLRPIPVGIKELRSFRVFNRWGQLIFSVKDASKGWDGKINGVEQATGTFIWIAEGVDYNGNLITRKGTATIVR